MQATPTAAAQCPACSTALTGAPTQCPQCGALLDGGAGARLAVTPALKLAAVILIINGIINLVEKVVFPSTGPGSSSSGLGGIILSVMVGFYLLTGKKEALTWARVMVIIGLVAFTAIAAFTGQTFVAVLQVLFSASLLNMLFGNPGFKRIALTWVFFVAYLALESVGVVAELKGYNLFGRLANNGLYHAEFLTSPDLDHQAFSLRAPGLNWSRRDPEAARKENAEAELWLVQPAYDAHTLVVPGRVDAGLSVAPQEVAAHYLETLKGNHDSWQLLAEGDLDLDNGGKARWFRGLGKDKGNDTGMEFYVVGYGRNRDFAALINFAVPVAAKALRADVEAMARGFVLKPRGR